MDDIIELKKELDALYNGYKSLAVQVNILRDAFTGEYQSKNRLRALLGSVCKYIDVSFGVAALLNNNNEICDSYRIGLEDRKLCEKELDWVEEIKIDKGSESIIRKPIIKNERNIAEVFDSKEQISGVCIPMTLDWRKQPIGIMCFFREANKPWTDHEANELRNIVSTATITLIQSAPDVIINAPWIGKDNVAIMFADIRGFSPITDKLMDNMDSGNIKDINDQPVDITDLLNDFFEAIIPEIKEEKRAWVDNLLGDGLIAFFDNDLESNDEKEYGVIRAVCAALKMRKAYEELYKKWEGEWIPSFKKKYSIDVNLKLGIGIDYGTVRFDVFGSGSFYQHTAIGDHVNFAKRLESIAARPYDKEKDFKNILISEPVYQRVNKFIDCEPYTPMNISGAPFLQRIYGVLGWRNVGEEICKSKVNCEDCDG